MMETRPDGRILGGTNAEGLASKNLLIPVSAYHLPVSSIERGC